MDAESLEKIIGLFAQLGAEAKWAFVAWIGLKVFQILAIAGTVITLAVMILRTIRTCSSDSRAFTAIRSLFDSAWFEHDKVVRKVTELVAKQK